MFLTVDLANPKPAYQQIVESVTRAIASGALLAGDRLPAIREAAVQTRVNRNTVSRAYLELEHLGLVQARQGSGYFVTDQGIAQERSQRVDALRQITRQLVSEAELAGVTPEQLVNLVRDALSEAQQGGEKNES